MLDMDGIVGDQEELWRIEGFHGMLVGRRSVSVSEKPLLQMRRQVGQSALRALNLGLDCSFCCWVAGPRLTQKECFSQTPASRGIMGDCGFSNPASSSASMSVPSPFSSASSPLSLFLSLSLSLHLSIHLYIVLIHIHIFLSFYLSIFLSFSLSIFRNFCICIFLSIYQYLCFLSPHNDVYGPPVHTLLAGGRAGYMLGDRT